MRRRLFLAAIGGGVISGAASGKAGPPPTGGRALINTYISNFEAGASKALPAPGSSVRLRIDSGRSYDPRSILVSTLEGDALGYLPSIHGRTLEPLLRAGFEMEAHVASMRRQPRPSATIEISVRAPADALRA